MTGNESPLLSYLLQNDPSFRSARLPALYSDFTSLQSLNPDGYTANLTAWQTALSRASKAGMLSSLLTLDPASLPRDLESKTLGRPLALDTVLSEAVKKREWLPLKGFMQSEGSIYRNSWTLNPWHLLGWGLRQLGFGGAAARGKVVLLPNLEEAGREFESRTRARKGRIDGLWSRSAFKEEFQHLLNPDKALEDADLEILLKFLERDKALLVYDRDTVKLTQGKEVDLTQEDATIASLKTLIADMETQTKVLENRIDQLTAQAQAAVERKNRVSALSALRSKKLAETTLSKRHATLAQLEEVFDSIEQAADQVELVKIMEGSTRVLKGLNEEAGGVERADDVVDQLREQMGRVNEVGDVLAEQGREGVDEGEVDDELEALENEERQKNEEAERRLREQKEQSEAEATRRRLAELEKGEEEKGKGTDKENDVDEMLSKSVEQLKKIRLDPTTQPEAA